MRYNFDFSHIRFFHIKNLPVIRGKGKILDVGCGTGEITSLISKNYSKYKVVGCDISPLRKKNLKFKFLQGNAEKLPFKNRSFENIFMFDVLEHIKYPKKAIKEIRRTIKPGGTFHLVVPIEASLYTIDGWIKRIWRINLKEKPIGHIQQFTLAEVKNMLEANGFKITKVSFSYYFLYQFLSVIYFFYANRFYKGKYVQLMPDKGGRTFFSLKPLIALGGIIINLENYFLGGLNIPAQEAHITCQI